MGVEQNEKRITMLSLPSSDCPDDMMQLVSSSSDGTVKLWDLRVAAKALRTFTTEQEASARVPVRVSFECFQMLLM